MCHIEGTEKRLLSTEKNPEAAISALDPSARTRGRPGTKPQTEQGAEQEAKASQSQGGMKTRSQTRKAAGQETEQEAKTSPLDQTIWSHGDPKTMSKRKRGAERGDDKIRMSFTSSTYRWPSDM